MFGKIIRVLTSQTVRKGSCLLVFISALVTALGVARSVELVNVSELQIQDFVHYLEYFRDFWSLSGRDLYSIGEQQRLIQELLRTPERSIQVMPIPCTPLSFVLFGPLAWLAGYSHSGAYLLWITLSAALLTYAISRAAISIEPSRSETLGFLALALIITFSSTWFRAIALGQFSIFASGAILLLHLLNRAKDRGSLRSLLLLFLSVKPIYLLLGIALSYQRRNERVLVATILLAATLSLIVLYLMGMGSFLSYLNTLGMYTSSTFPAEYRQSIDPSTMTTALPVGSRFFPIESLKPINTFFFYASLVIGIGIAIKERATSDYSLRPILAGLVAVLIFSPYLGRYEDLLVIVPAALLLSQKGKELSRLTVMLMSLFLVLALFDFGETGINLTGKCGMLLLMGSRLSIPRLPNAKTSGIPVKAVV